MAGGTGNGLSHQENVRCCGYKIHNYFWFMLSGALCDCCQALIDYVLYQVYWLPYERETMWWGISYSLSIMIRHVSHRYIVFGEYDGTYCSSLCRTYATYSSSIVLSMLTNHLVVNYFGFSHRDAWILTMLWIGVYNYFMLKKNWRREGTSADKDKVSSSTSGSGSGEGDHLLGDIEMPSDKSGDVRSPRQGAQHT